jgi:hypothetical protein
VLWSLKNLAVSWIDKGKWQKHILNDVEVLNSVSVEAEMTTVLLTECCFPTHFSCSVPHQLSILLHAFYKILHFVLTN